MSAFVFVFVLCVLFAIGARGVHVEQTDAGENGVSEAQPALLDGPSDSITGSIAASNDADLFSFCVSDPSSFSATTVGTVGTLGDTQLFVFDSAGRAIFGNDDFPNSAFRSQVTSANFTANGGVAGLNHIAITGFNRDPVFSNNAPLDPTAVLSHFVGGSESGTYTIVLTGVEPCPTTVTGDPHLAGAHGIKFDVFGAPGGVYSLVVAPAFEINMQLAKHGPELRFMTAMTVLFRGKSFTIEPWTAKAKRAELVAHFESLGSKISIKDWRITIELCAGHTISFMTFHQNNTNYLDFRLQVPGCHDSYGGLLGQTYQCKIAKETFNWTRERGRRVSCGDTGDAEWLVFSQW